MGPAKHQKDEPLAILLIDDERVVEQSIGEYLRERGHTVSYVDRPELALQLLHTRQFDVAVSDIRMPGMDGIALLREMKNISPETEVILITGHGTIDDAVAALRIGAADFIRKPVDLRELELAIGKAARLRRLRGEREQFREGLTRAAAPCPAGRPGDCPLLGASPAIRKLREIIDRTAASPATTILITGETGTGKELATRLIHFRGIRAAGPLIGVNCAAFAPNLIESELFGHEAGAFTGALGRRKGVFELAHGGTLFLDEIGDMTPELQGRLLRILEERMVRRLGGQKSIPVELRLIAATNRDLAALVREGKFRKDLYYRLRVATIEMPPLRGHKTDIPLLIGHFLDQLAVQFRRPVPDLDPAVRKLLLAYDYPGNVRELKNLLEEGMLLAGGGMLAPEHFPALGPGAALPGPVAGGLREMEEQRIREAVAAAKGNLRQAAKSLGIGYGALRYRLEK